MKINNLLNIPYEFSMSTFLERIKTFQKNSRDNGILYHHEFSEITLREENSKPNLLPIFEYDEFSIQRNVISPKKTQSIRRKGSTKAFFKNIRLIPFFYNETEMKKECIINICEIFNFFIMIEKTESSILLSFLKDKQDSLLYAKEHPENSIEFLFSIIRDVLKADIYKDKKTYPVIKKNLITYMDLAEESRNIFYILMINYYFKNLVNSDKNSIWEVEL